MTSGDLLANGEANRVFAQVGYHYQDLLSKLEILALDLDRDVETVEIIVDIAGEGRGGLFPRQRPDDVATGEPLCLSDDRETRDRSRQNRIALDKELGVLGKDRLGRCRDDLGLQVEAVDVAVENERARGGRIRRSSSETGRDARLLGREGHVR